MDEAERCHRLAFIFKGGVLDVGTPEEVVERRKLRVVELEVDNVPLATELLEHAAEIEECAHFGHILRVATRDRDPLDTVRALLDGHAVRIRASNPGRPNVEDAFVSMVREAS
jgi:ABC-2 type transport system ATP-binding protein